MFRRAAAAQGISLPPDSKPRSPVVIDLPVEWQTAIEWWDVWTNHNIMAVAGGYLDQPEVWRRTILMLSEIYSEQSKAVSEWKDRYGDQPIPKGAYPPPPQIEAVPSELAQLQELMRRDS